jgi:hypothetical protein
MIALLLTEIDEPMRANDLKLTEDPMFKLKQMLHLNRLPILQMPATLTPEPTRVKPRTESVEARV